jgi:hypothetical protein
MNYITATIDELIPMIENIDDGRRSEPRKGLLRLRELCINAIDILSADNPFAHEPMKIQSTVWMIEQITATESGFDRWLLFVLRSKKAACAGMLRNYALKTKPLIAA